MTSVYYYGRQASFPQCQCCPGPLAWLGFCFQEGGLFGYVGTYGTMGTRPGVLGHVACASASAKWPWGCGPWTSISRAFTLEVWRMRWNGLEERVWTRRDIQIPCDEMAAAAGVKPRRETANLAILWCGKERSDSLSVVVGGFVCCFLCVIFPARRRKARPVHSIPVPGQQAAATEPLHSLL